MLYIDVTVRSLLFSLYLNQYYSKGNKMENIQETKFEDFEASLLRKPEIRKEYDALIPKYTIIRNLIKRRNELNISQVKLASIIGTKQPAISRLERGDCNATLDTLFKVAEALDLHIELSPIVRKSEEAPITQ